MLTLVSSSPPPTARPTSSAPAHLLGHHERAGEVGLGQQHQELVAAIAIGGVDQANRVADHPAQHPQHVVAAMMAE